MTPSVVVDGLTKHFRRRDGATVRAIDDASLTVERGEFVVLLGPSGCGKTTLLRSVAGLETPDDGSVSVDGKVLYSAADRICVPPERRGLSMMFQSYALWPHMTAARNVRYPLENRRPRRNRAAMDAKVRDVLDLVGIADLAEQYPAQLSGGQQQRVALARALVDDSSLVLFDEPLSNVDAKVREQLRVELLATQNRLGFTALFVTHDQAEAMELATRIAVLDDGKVQQFDTPENVYRRPATEYVARFIGTTNEVTGTLTGDGSYDTSVGRFVVAPTADLPTTATILWRPEATALSVDRPAGPNAYAARVATSLFLGTHTEHLVRVGDLRVRVWSQGGASFARDQEVWLTVAPEDLMVFGGSGVTAPARATVEVGA